MDDKPFELQLDTMAHGGSALGRHGRKTVFVPYTIPGERVLARVLEDKGRVAFAEGVTLVESSADRVFPRCGHFGPGRCGRCQWQHIDYPAQLLLKQDVLADQLERIGGFADADVRAVLPSPEQWNYNYYLTFTLVDGAHLALPGAGSRAFAINECHILHPALLQLKDSLDLEQFTGLQTLTLQIGSDNAHMLILTLDADEAPELEANLPTSVNMLLADNEPVNLIGESHVRYTINGRTFRVTAGSSFRANVAQVPNLVDMVLDALRLTGSETVLDLYAGVGLFSAFIAPHASLVTLVESYPPAVTDAETNLADLDNVDIFEGVVEDVLEELDEKYDAALIDPPPGGLSTDAVDALVAQNIPRLVYVSSDPATLARDGKRLAAAGYHLRYAQPIDFAPQTYYIDTVALFEK